MSLDLSIVRYRTVFLNLLPESWYECSTSLSAGCLGNPSHGDKVHLSWSGHLLMGSSHIQNTGCNSGTGKANVYIPLIHILTFSFIHVSENSLISSITFLEPRLNCNWTFHQPNPPQLYGFPLNFCRMLSLFQNMMLAKEMSHILPYWSSICC